MRQNLISAVLSIITATPALDKYSNKSKIRKLSFRIFPEIYVRNKLSFEKKLILSMEIIKISKICLHAAHLKFGSCLKHLLYRLFSFCFLSSVYLRCNHTK